MITDEYGEVINNEENYQVIAHTLQQTGSCLIGWTDQDYTHFDILFVYKDTGVKFFGSNLQGGVRPTDLFVSIMRIGTFGFEVKNTDTHPGYYAEKLTSHFGEPTGEKLAQLINGVKKNLIKE